MSALLSWLHWAWPSCPLRLRGVRGSGAGDWKVQAGRAARVPRWPEPRKLHRAGSGEPGRSGPHRGAGGGAPGAEGGHRRGCGTAGGGDVCSQGGHPIWGGAPGGGSPANAGPQGGVDDRVGAPARQGPGNPYGGATPKATTAGSGDPAGVGRGREAAGRRAEGLSRHGRRNGLAGAGCRDTGRCRTRFNAPGLAPGSGNRQAPPMVGRRRGIGLPPGASQGWGRGGAMAPGA